MLSYTKEVLLFPFNAIAVSIPRVALAIVLTLIVFWIVLSIGLQIFNGFRNKTIMVTKNWEFSFKSQPIRFVLIIFIYSSFFLIVSYAGYSFVYALITR